MEAFHERAALLLKKIVSLAGDAVERIIRQIATDISSKDLPTARFMIT